MENARLPSSKEEGDSGFSRRTLFPLTLIYHHLYGLFAAICSLNGQHVNALCRCLYRASVS